MELNETGLFGIAVIPKDLSRAKSLCFGKYQSILETVSNVNFYSYLNFYLILFVLL